MNIIYLLLGSNLKDRLAALKAARDAVAESIGNIAAESAVYESEPWGFHSADQFLNQVIKVETCYDPFEIMRIIGDIETRLGRTRHPAGGYISRIIDIDILFYNNEIIKDDKLIIPHPKIQDRMFTLLPLTEIAGGLVHPGYLKSVGELVKECRDTLQVYLYNPKNPTL
jgi:2-amino-4-hydroxy-6-hydroxymethyldihydropteridine diphosphokinase